MGKEMWGWVGGWDGWHCHLQLQHSVVRRALPHLPCKVVSARGGWFPCVQCMGTMQPLLIVSVCGSWLLLHCLLLHCYSELLFVSIVQGQGLWTDRQGVCWNEVDWLGGKGLLFSVLLWQEPQGELIRCVPYSSPPYTPFLPLFSSPEVLLYTSTIR